MIARQHQNPALLNVETRQFDNFALEKHRLIGVVEALFHLICNQICIFYHIYGYRVCFSSFKFQNYIY